MTTSKVKKQALSSEDVANGKQNQDWLPPMTLVLVVMFCSGAQLALGMRDYLSTGRNVAGAWDEAMLLFTKSTDWFVDAKGWKSTQGGFSAVMPATTDANNMGGFFVRKLMGAATIGVNLQKLWPFVSISEKTSWVQGHYHPMLYSALAGNLMCFAFYASYAEDLKIAQASEFGLVIMSLLFAESCCLVYFLLTCKVQKPNTSVAMKDGKTPTSYVSSIVTRTIMLVSGMTAVIMLRDLFVPGFILPLLPRDDIYLEWTNALIHSPPDGSPEAHEHGIDSPFYVGDRFVSQLNGLFMVILCLHKYVAAVFVRLGSDGSGAVQCKMTWQPQAVAGTLILFVFRVFQPAALSASLDLRWHLMCIAYETFILGVYGFT